MTLHQRSECPINLAIEAIGDTWSLVLIRDIIFGGRRTYRDLLTQSLEGISTNILADRLRSLVAAGILTRADDPSHRQRGIYSLTEQGVELLPILVELGAWGRKYLPASRELSIRAQLMEEGGPELLRAFMDELRYEHLGVGERPERWVRDELQAAYEAVVASVESEMAEGYRAEATDSSLDSDWTAVETEEL